MGPDVDGSPPPARAPDRELLVGEGLRVRHGGKTVLDVERVALREGELLAVLGPNGAGKSTLLRVLAMLQPPDAGLVRYRGAEGKAARRALRATSAAVFQRPHFWRDTVAWNVGLGLRLRGLPATEVDARVRRIAEGLGIGELLERDVETLSGGQAQRVALARALAVDPTVLFLDEPTASLDAPARADLRQDLERLARERAGSVLLVTHDRHEAFWLADRIAVLVDGKLVQAGTPTELYENPADPYIARVTGAELALRGVVRERSEPGVVVQVDGASLLAMGDAAPGAAVKVAYRPEDLILSPAAEEVRRLSTRNAFYATVAEARRVGGLVRLRLDGPPDVVAVVTGSAAEELGLCPGVRVSVRVKATALHAFPV